MHNILQSNTATTNPRLQVKSFYVALGRGDVPAVLALLGSARETE